MAKKRYTPEEKAAALAALRANRGNVAKTAEQVGVPRKTLAHWAKEQNIKHEPEGVANTGEPDSPLANADSPPDSPVVVTEKCRGEWTWTAPREEAARLLAEDALTDEEIAGRAGITPRQLYYWKQRPEFAARIREAADMIGRAALRYAIARRTRRVEDLDNIRRGLLEVIAERGADPAHQVAPGGKSGLLVRRLKMIGSGPAAHEVTEFEFDAALVKELREVEKQAAQEVGQWTEKHEHRGADGQSLPAGSVTHNDIHLELNVYAGAFQQFAQSVLAGPGGGPLPPDGATEPLDSAEAPGAPGRLPGP